MFVEILLGHPDILRHRITMQITNALLWLWIGCSTSVSSVCFIAGSRNVLRVVTQYLVNGELEGGKAFAIGFPLLGATAFALGGAIAAVVGLLVSWRVNKQRLFSFPHFITLLFFIPLVPILVMMPYLFFH